LFQIEDRFSGAIGHHDRYVDQLGIYPNDFIFFTLRRRLDLRKGSRRKTRRQ
jgi:hypothetical protein